MLGGLLVWTAHFFGLYIVASIFPETGLARVLAGVLTLAGLAVDAYLLRRAAAELKRDKTEEVRRWQAVVAALAAAVSFVAVLWQGLPALIG